ncbi:helix-turn-helix domain-containing protein [Aurantimonas endophytica]|uniref:Transcriptional regulator with XRE-family HTH domain n=1 Tax=Aurantimonas endophytica TaxID=1522175 RepID=A0A7W6HFF3_9HYPH|nr:helix-turn-helix transcriptional regulator [Aurantimonas endophytica]MBB4004151.1 transcriptional regulator with XRE-family HTH domain [Aurantimonas endophytica]MCO6404994.1 helix-turn-helix domain-containing protein [Aurantimonas endophytica]
MTTTSDTVGDVLRDWRRRRRLSQMALAGEADISTRHLSFVESGRAAPSREMLMRLAEPLALPLRERNRLLLAGGYAPLYPERGLDAPDLAAAREAVEAILAAHDPYPALAVDRHWTLVAANRAVNGLLADVAPNLLEPPVNVLRLSLSPEGLAPSIVNLAEWRQHLLERLRHDATSSGDGRLIELHDELRAIPVAASMRPPHRNATGIAVPLVLRRGDTTLSFLSTTTVFGTATDVALAELTLEAFLPADPATREALAGGR